MMGVLAGMAEAKHAKRLFDMDGLVLDQQTQELVKDIESKWSKVMIDDGVKDADQVQAAEDTETKQDTTKET